MTKNILNHSVSLINEQSYQREELAIYLRQSAALIKMALSQCFQEQEEHEQHDYLWAISNLLDTAKVQNEAQIKELMAQEATLLAQQVKR